MVSGIGRLGVKIHGLRCVNIHKWGGMLKFSLVVKWCGASGILFGVRGVAAIYHMSWGSMGLRMLGLGQGRGRERGLQSCGSACRAQALRTRLRLGWDGVNWVGFGEFVSSLVLGLHH